MMIKNLILSVLFFLLSFSIHAQGLEKIIVEKYYISNATDLLFTNNDTLPKGAITYRIFVDLKPGYSLQAVYGVPNHELLIGTTTFFYNSKNGEKTGDLINDKKINENTLALDSWLTLGAATKSHFGVLKSDDKDGSIIKRNSLTVSDGLVAGKIIPIAFFGIDPDFLNNVNKSAFFSTKNGSWAVFGNIKGPTPENQLLIAQLTTNGELSFELNIQIGTPTGSTENYVAKNPEGKEIKFTELSFGR